MSRTHRRKQDEGYLILCLQGDGESVRTMQCCIVPSTRSRVRKGTRKGRVQGQFKVCSKNFYNAPKRQICLLPLTSQSSFLHDKTKEPTDKIGSVCIDSAFHNSPHFVADAKETEHGRLPIIKKPRAKAGRLNRRPRAIRNNSDCPHQQHPRPLRRLLSVKTSSHSLRFQFCVRLPRLRLRGPLRLSSSVPPVTELLMLPPSLAVFHPPPSPY